MRVNRVTKKLGIGGIMQHYAVHILGIVRMLSRAVGLFRGFFSLLAYS